MRTTSYWQTEAVWVTAGLTSFTLGGGGLPSTCSGSGCSAPLHLSLSPGPQCAECLLPGRVSGLSAACSAQTSLRLLPAGRPACFHQSLMRPLPALPRACAVLGVPDSLQIFAMKSLEKKKGALNFFPPHL